MAMLREVVLIRCAEVLLPSGFRRSVEIRVSESGRIQSISGFADHAAAIEAGLSVAPPEASAAPCEGARAHGSDDSPRLDGPVLELNGLVLPGMPNLHSHAFQRLLAGRAEFAAPVDVDDSFWSWRDTMYRLAEWVSEEALEAAAAQLYVEMLEAGYTSVAEFHYLHRDPLGGSYSPLGRLGRAILRAAEGVGIDLTLLPVLYLTGGFGTPPTHRQRRFVHQDLDSFLQLLHDLECAVGSAETSRLGVAAHSLRAVDLETVSRLSEAARGLSPSTPIHIHIAEQPAEVEACRAALGQSPVNALVDRVGIDARWCLVHATHASSDERRRVAEHGAVVGLCPSTEANLGDGAFPLRAYLKEGGCFGVGSDSHVCVDPAEELRWLEYQARTKSLRRNRLALDGQPPRLGRTLWARAVAGGNQALGEAHAGLEVGSPANLIELDRSHPRLVGLSGPEVVDSLILGSAPQAVRRVLVRGRAVVDNGLHYRRVEVAERYRLMASQAAQAFTS